MTKTLGSHRPGGTVLPSLHTRGTNLQTSNAIGLTRNPGQTNLVKSAKTCLSLPPHDNPSHSSHRSFCKGQRSRSGARISENSKARLVGLGLHDFCCFSPRLRSHRF